MSVRGFLEVHVGPDHYGLPLAEVDEVTEVGEVLAIPRRLGALRGITPYRGHLTPLVHLGALLSGGDVPDEAGQTIVLTRMGPRRVALEVDDADAVRRDEILAVPPGQHLPWALGVARLGGRLIPILDLIALGDRVMEVEEPPR